MLIPLKRRHGIDPRSIACAFYIAYIIGITTVTISILIKHE